MSGERGPSTTGRDRAGRTVRRREWASSAVVTVLSTLLSVLAGLAANLLTALVRRPFDLRTALAGAPPIILAGLVTAGVVLIRRRQAASPAGSAIAALQKYGRAEVYRAMAED